MKLSTFAIIVTVLAVLFGLAFIIIPGQVGEFYGIAHNTGGRWVSRYWGATLIFIGMIYWSYSSVSPAAKSWPKLLVFSIIYDVMQLGLTLAGIYKGVGNSNSWSTVALYALLIIGSWYFLGVCKKARVQAA
jgi:hypothetical protein